MARPLSELGKRLFGGGLFALIAGVDIWFGGLAFAAMLAVGVVLLTREFLRLTVPEMPVHTIVLVAVWPLAAILSFQLGTRTLGLDDSQAVSLGLWMLVAGMIVLAVLRLMRQFSYWLAFAVVYVGLPMIAFQWLRETSDGQGLEHVAWLVVVIVATDCFAYAAGRTFGGPKLAPKISPGKTWSGLVGGVTGAALVAVLAGSWMAGWNMAALLVLGASLAVLAQSGDLFESWLKRRAGTKDSGTLIPGHGGLLDRLDGYMTATPVYAVLLALWGPI